MTWSTVSTADPPEAAAHKHPGAPRGREPIAYKRPSFEEPKSQYQPLPRVGSLLTGATLLDGVGGRADDVDVLMRNGVIVAVGRHLRQEGVSVIDARGRWVTPGIVDIHTHYGTYLLPQTAAESTVSDVLGNSDPNVADTW